jgi:hypothetical protein
VTDAIFTRVRFRAYGADEGIDFDPNPPPPPPPPPPGTLQTMFDNVTVVDVIGPQFSADFAAAIVPPFASADPNLSVGGGVMVADTSDSYAESPLITVATGAVVVTASVMLTADGLDPATGYTGGVEFGPDVLDILSEGDSIAAGNVMQGIFLDYSGGTWQFGTSFTDGAGNYKFGGPLTDSTWYTIAVTLTPTGSEATDPYGCAITVNGVDSGLSGFSLNPLGDQTKIRVGYIGSVGP